MPQNHGILGPVWAKSKLADRNMEGAFGKLFRGSARHDRSLPDAHWTPMTTAITRHAAGALAKCRFRSTETPFGEPERAKLGQMQAPEHETAVLGARTRRIWPNAGSGARQRRLGSPNTPDLAKYRLRSTKTPFWEPKHVKLGQLRAQEY